MISTRRDLYLIMISYSNQKEFMDLHDLARFLENEQKVEEKLIRITLIYHVRGSVGLILDQSLILFELILPTDARSNQRASS